MLSNLHIENIAVIESAEIMFDDGFNVLTGETGAGKSIIIDSIGAVMGYRTSRDLIRSGAEQAYVSALFRHLQQETWMDEAGIALDEDGAVLFERSFRADGKNICRIQGRPVTVSQMRDIGQQILNIHGQHDGQLLLDEHSHLHYLDAFGETAPELEDYLQSYEIWRALKRESETLQIDESEKARRIDILQFQIAELEEASLVEGEEEPLLQRRNLLRNIEKVSSAVEEAYFALQGSEQLDGATSLLSIAGRSLHHGARVSEELEELAERAEDLRYQVLDLAEEVGDMRSSLDNVEGQLDEIESRLDLLSRLQRKYGETVEKMLEYLQLAKEELDQISFAEEHQQQLQEKTRKAFQEAERKANILSEKREKVKGELERRIRQELSELDMPKVQFVILQEPVALHEQGADQVRFLMSANTGEDLKPIHKIASGGELARIMLALKNVLSESDSVSTMIFDEVDTGVSGRAAQKVAEKMCQISRKRQILCITHLPQIAAMADTHFSVEKGEEKGRTFTRVEKLDFEQRKLELARISGGTVITNTQLQSAAELLQLAEKFKQKEMRKNRGCR